MPSTFVHGVLPPGCVALSHRALPKMNRWQWAKLMVISAFLGNGPDWDVVPATLLHNFEAIHREWGHNIFSVILLIVLGRFLIARFVSKEFSPASLWMTSSILVLSHLILDSAGDYDINSVRPGVPLFWPFSTYELVMPFTLFRWYQVDKTINPLMGHLTSLDYWFNCAIVELSVTVALLLLWAGLYNLVRWTVLRARADLKSGGAGFFFPFRPARIKAVAKARGDTPLRKK